MMPPRSMLLHMLPAIILSCLFFSKVAAVDEGKLKQFFADTYLRKETGYFSPKTKRFPDGYQMNWDWYHFHHVCIQRGFEGIHVGLPDFVNDWKAANSGNNSASYISEEEWNSPKMRNPNVNDFWHSQVGLYEAKRLDVKTVGKISVLEGGTLFFNCETPLSFERYKQFDWMSKLAVFYELSNYFIKNADQPTFKFPWTYPFHHVLMNRCVDPTTYQWQLGANFFDLVKEKMETANITREGYTNFFRDEPKETSNTYICVDDLYFSTRIQSFVSGYDNQVEFRNDAMRRFGIPKEAPTEPEKKIEIPPWVRLPYCGKNPLARNYPARIVFVKIKGFLESGTVNNADDVIRLLQSLSTQTVQVVTVSSAKSFSSAATTVFDAADIIVAPYSGLPLLGIFAKWPFTKIFVELTPYMHNPVFYRSFRRLNFADYVVSTGHYTQGDKKNCPLHVIRDFKSLSCNISRHSFPKRSLQERYLCPWAAERVFSCNMEINLKLLRAQLVESIRHMCKNGTDWEELKRAPNSRLKGPVIHSRKYDPRHKFGKWFVFNPKKPRRMEIDVNAERYPMSYTFTYESHPLYEKAMNMTGGVALPSWKYYLSVLATFKNEGHIIEEWLEHHIAHGVEHFYLVNDHSTDNSMTLLQPYIENGIITMFNAPTVNSQFRQVTLYRNSIVRLLATNETRWVAIIDLDEFLYAPKDVDIKNILKENEGLALVGLNWVWFGANSYAKQPGSVIQSFTSRADYDISKYPEFLKRYKMMNPTLLSPSSAWQKYILNLEYKVVDVDVHGANIEGTIDNMSYLRYPEDPPLLLNHYMVQSKDFFMSKGQKADINNFRAPNLFTEEWFQILSLDDILDTRLAEQNKQNSIAMRFVRTEDAAYQTLVKLVPEIKDETSDSADENNAHFKMSSPAAEKGLVDAPDAKPEDAEADSEYERGDKLPGSDSADGGAEGADGAATTDADSGAPALDASATDAGVSDTSSAAMSADAASTGADSGQSQNVLSTDNSGDSGSSADAGGDLPRRGRGNGDVGNGGSTGGLGGGDSGSTSSSSGGFNDGGGSGSGSGGDGSLNNDNNANGGSSYTNSGAGDGGAIGNGGFNDGGAGGGNGGLSGGSYANNGGNGNAGGGGFSDSNSNTNNGFNADNSGGVQGGDTGGGFGG